MISDDHAGLKTGLILVGAAAGAPFLPKLAQTARGPLALGVGLMVALMVVTIVYLPLVLPLLLPVNVEVDSWEIAKSLIFLMLLPLVAGLLVRARYQELGTKIQPVATQASTIAVAFLMVTLLVVNFEEIIDTVGTGGILAALIVLVGAFAVGFLVGGRPEEQRSVLGLGSGPAQHLSRDRGCRAELWGRPRGHHDGDGGHRARSRRYCSRRQANWGSVPSRGPGRRKVGEATLSAATRRATRPASEKRNRHAGGIVGLFPGVLVSNLETGIRHHPLWVRRFDRRWAKDLS